jgi:hypothetical protein
LRAFDLIEGVAPCRKKEGARALNGSRISFVSLRCFYEYHDERGAGMETMGIALFSGAVWTERADGINLPLAA